MKNILDLVERKKGVRYCFNIRGTNGSGKTSLAKMFMKDGYEEIGVIGLKKPGFVYCPPYNALLVGNYRNKCGGCDNLVKAQIVKLLRLAWMTDCNIIYEGVLVANSGWPYLNLMREYSQDIAERVYGFVYLDLPVEECLRRIYQRNGGKAINEQLVLNKHRDAIRYRQLHLGEKDCQVLTLDATQPQETMFLELIQELSKFSD